MKIISIAEFLTQLNLDLIEMPDEEVFFDMDLFEYLAWLGIVGGVSVYDYDEDDD